MTGADDGSGPIPVEDPEPNDRTGTSSAPGQPQNPWVPPGHDPAANQPPLPASEGAGPPGRQSPPPAAVDPSWPPPAGWPPPAPEPSGWPQSTPAQPGSPTWPAPQQSPSAPVPAAGWGVPDARPAAQPGVVPLRPLSLGEILDGAITYIRRNPAATLGTAAVITAISGVLQLILVLATTNGLGELLNPEEPVTAEEFTQLVASLGGSAGLLLSTVVSWLLSILATGLLTLMMGAAVLGSRLELGEAWRLVAPRLPALLALTLLVGLTLMGVFVGISAVGVLLVAIDAGPASVLGLLLFLALAAVATIWLWVKLLLAPVIVVLERAGPLQSWRRSLSLVRGGWWRTFGIQLLALVITWLIGTVVAVPFQIAATAFSSGSPDDTMFWVLITIGSVVSGVVTLPFAAGVISLIYLDRRMRTEGFDMILQLPGATDDLSVYRQEAGP